jgi:hypothetical protein
MSSARGYKKTRLAARRNASLGRERESKIVNNQLPADYYSLHTLYIVASFSKTSTHFQKFLFFEAGKAVVTR